MRITGGAELQASQPRRFIPGEAAGYTNRCLSAVDALGPCKVEPCTDDRTDFGKSLFTGGEIVPREFANGTIPRPLMALDYTHPDGGPERIPQTPPTPAPTPAPTPSIANWVGVNNFYVIDTRGVRSAPLSLTRVNNVSKAAYPSGFSIEVDTQGTVPTEWINFSVNSKLQRVERAARWCLSGDHMGYFAPWSGYELHQVFLLRAQAGSTKASHGYGSNVQLLVVD